MKLIETRVYRGPSPYGYRPLIRMTLDLETLEAYPSDKVPGFVPALLAAITAHLARRAFAGGGRRRV